MRILTFIKTFKKIAYIKLNSNYTYPYIIKYRLNYIYLLIIKVRFDFDSIICTTIKY